jgi:hypothetical protein
MKRRYGVGAFVDVYEEWVEREMEGGMADPM